MKRYLNHVRQVGFVVPVLISLLVLVYWTTPTPTAAQAPAPAKLDTVTPAIAGGLDHVPTVVGLEKGIYAKYGIDLKPKVFGAGTGTENLSALKAGQTQFAPASPIVIAMAVKENIPMTVIAVASGVADSEYYDMDTAIVARAGSGIEKGKPATLKGKRIGVALNTRGHHYLGKVLNRAGVALSDVTFVNISPPDLPAALDGKNIDAEAIWDPIARQTISRVRGSYEVLRGGGYSNAQNFYATSTDLYKKNPDLVERYLTGFSEAFQFARQEKNWDEAAKIATRWFTGLDYETARSLIPNIRWDPRISKANCMAGAEMVKFLMQIGRLDQPVDVCQFVDLTILNKVMSKRPELFSDLPAIPPQYR